MKLRDIVILHGWNLTGSRFASLAAIFQKKGYRVWTPDLPGFGEEPEPKRAWHVVDYAEFLERYIAKHHIRTPLLIGHSFGGRVALKYTQLYSENVRALVLTGTPGFSPVPKKKLFFFLVVSKLGRVLFSIPPLDFFADWARRWLYYLAGAREFLHAEGVMRETFKYIVQDDLLSAMASVQCPCLLLWAEFDVIVPKAIAYQMKEVIRSAAITVIPEADHGVPFKAPDIFSHYVDRFIQTCV